MGIDFYRDELRRIFNNDDDESDLVQYVVDDDVKIFDSRTNISWQNLNPIVNDWSAGFISGYLIAKYGNNIEKKTS